MAGNPRFTDLVQDRLTSFLDEQDTSLGTIAPELLELTTAARELLIGGKRFRARFCYWGWAAVARLASEEDLLAEGHLDENLDTVVSAAAALELFHAGALVHDDIMDNSDIRRGSPSVHRRFETQHRMASWSGSADGYGRSTALLLGDALLVWSDEVAQQAFASLPPSDAAAARAEFARMRSEVAMGQYLDILEEVSWGRRSQAELLDRAHRVVVYKSAKYSVEAPLALGAALAGASFAQVAALSAFGLPLGVAFQLRDDILGVYGDEAVTGKPAGDDLRQGKRTLLVHLARQSLPANQLRIVDELLGDPDLDADQIRVLQSAIRESGAVAAIERAIAARVAHARAALDDAPIAGSARHELLALAEAVAERDR